MKIAFTGHRKQLWLTIENEEFNFINKLSAYLSNITEPYTFIVGGCTGVDSFAATYALSHRIPYDLYVPFPLLIHARTKWFNKEDGYNLLNQHKYCQNKRVASEVFDTEAYYKRDKWMVEDADILIAYYYKEKSGSGNCVRYAESIGKPVVRLRTWKG